ncbi:hypothetical protein KZJ38_07425 [Paraburkholderia edwinii]|uniref:Uncharacterized protein n=1 Tax=Paraburkholderia edwinii TaxID=2861782 RepID=A0ABX8UMB4_9BURK|nr:hypothetical protein [Paraburkholderia edwinii]QYD70131.1 hypothetical protein KZJ38_07425 [Paraburkholderia edwinii]
MNQTQLYEDLGVEPDTTPLDSMFQQVGVGIAVGFAMFDNDEDNYE